MRRSAQEVVIKVNCIANYLVLEWKTGRVCDCDDRAGVGGTRLAWLGGGWEGCWRERESEGEAPRGSRLS